MTPLGGQERLNRLVSEHIPAAMRFAMRLTGRAAWAEEIVQESLYRAVRSASTFRGESQFRTWLFRIVVCVFRDRLDVLRKDAATGQICDDVVDPRGADPAEAAAACEFHELVAQRVSSLPPRQREVLVLIAYEQFSPRQVAAMLGISVSNVHANLHYARQRLRAELAPYLVVK